MKCPQCGHWNRANFPRCFRCGTPLLQAVNAAPVWEDELKKAAPPKIVHVYDEEELAQHEVKMESTLAAEMTEFKQRRQRGVEKLATLRKDAAQQGIAPTGGTVQSDFPNEFMEGFEDAAFEPVEQRQRRMAAREAAEDPPDKPDTEPFWQDESYDDLPPYVIGKDVPPGDMETRPITPFQTRAQRHKRSQGPFALAVWLVRIMALGLVAAAAYIVIGQVVDRNAREPAAATVAYELEQAVVKERPGHSGAGRRADLHQRAAEVLYGRRRVCDHFHPGLHLL
ncbi:MAG TPA: zinc ribbon domain-containing protein [Clostridia bacterium]|nr:zinc ribbon domain-containing protein [Clostridia bacterium]